MADSTSEGTTQRLRITQVKSSNGASPQQRDTLRTLGLRRIGASTERPDHPAVRGMIRTVNHLVAVETPTGAGGDG
jgi:large subunit ribosomal protein L30